MSVEANDVLRDVLARYKPIIIQAWLARLNTSDGVVTGRIRGGELHGQAEIVLSGLHDSLVGGPDGDAAFRALEAELTEVARVRAVQGFTPTDTAMFVFSLKEPIFDALKAAHSEKLDLVANGIWDSTVLIDRLGLHTIEVFLKSR